jgi:hypothetical protein
MVKTWEIDNSFIVIVVSLSILLTHRLKFKSQFDGFNSCQVPGDPQDIVGLLQDAVDHLQFLADPMNRRICDSLTESFTQKKNPTKKVDRTLCALYIGTDDLVRLFSSSTGALFLVQLPYPFVRTIDALPSTSSLFLGSSASLRGQYIT